ncbi:hypothetical protein ACF1G4_03200 [Streptomyces caelestis]
MPMIVDLTAPQITPPVTVVSPEGWLRAVVDAQWAGVVLAYDGATPPAARNLVLNPSAEVNLTEITLYNSATLARVTSDARYGTAAVQVTTGAATFGGAQYGISPQGAGTTITASAWVKVSGAGTTVFFAFRSNAATLGTVSAGTPTANQWTRVSVQYTVPAGQTCTRVAIAYNAGSGVVWLADAMMVETGVSAPSDYIDGSLPGGAWEGTPHASPSIRATAVPSAAQVRKVRITRQDPGAAEPVPVRSADLAWALDGAGQAYDHEAPLGVAVVYTATPQYADGTWGPSTSLGLVVPAPAPAQTKDLWLKSLEEPGLSMRVMYGPAQGTTSAARQDTADRTGTPYTAVAYDTAAAPAESVQVDVLAEDIVQFRKLIRSGVLLAQVRPGYLIPDRYFVPGEVTEKPTGKLGSTGGYTCTFDIVPIERPATAGQPMRAPGWSYDAVAAAFAAYDAVAASYSSYAALATNGAVT